LRGRLLFDEGTARLGGLHNVLERLVNSKRIIISACGTSWHAGLVGEYMFEQFVHIPTEVEYASEFRYRNPIIYPDDAIFFISQSGETADTLAALREAKAKVRLHWESVMLWEVLLQEKVCLVFILMLVRK